MKIAGDIATVEGGGVARFDHQLDIRKGDFVQATGDVIVAKLSKADGLKIRRLIKKLNS